MCTKQSEKPIRKRSRYHPLDSLVQRLFWAGWRNVLFVFTMHSFLGTFASPKKMERHKQKKFNKQNKHIMWAQFLAKIKRGTKKKHLTLAELFCSMPLRIQGA